jgi:hypothetical protein
MPFVKRDEQGNIVAVSQAASPDFDEELPAGHPALTGFVEGVTGHVSNLAASDLDLIRVLDDVVELLIAKGVILFTDLPEDAQQKIFKRQQLRAQLGGLHDLVDND